MRLFFKSSTEEFKAKVHQHKQYHGNGAVDGDGCDGP